MKRFMVLAIGCLLAVSALGAPLNQINNGESMSGVRGKMNAVILQTNTNTADIATKADASDVAALQYGVTNMLDENGTQHTIVDYVAANGGGGSANAEYAVHDPWRVQLGNTPQENATNLIATIRKADGLTSVTNQIYITVPTAQYDLTSNPLHLTNSYVHLICNTGPQVVSASKDSNTVSRWSTDAAGAIFYGETGTTDIVGDFNVSPNPALIYISNRVTVVGISFVWAEIESDSGEHIIFDNCGFHHSYVDINRDCSAIFKGCIGINSGVCTASSDLTGAKFNGSVENCFFHDVTDNSFGGGATGSVGSSSTKKAVLRNSTFDGHWPLRNFLGGGGGSEVNVLFEGCQINASNMMSVASGAPVTIEARNTTFYNNFLYNTSTMLNGANITDGGFYNCRLHHESMQSITNGGVLVFANSIIPASVTNAADSVSQCTDALTYAALGNWEASIEAGIAALESQKITVPTAYIDANATLTDAQCYGYTFFTAGGITINLPPLQEGMSITFIVTGGTLSINPDDGDVITLNGNYLDAGDSVWAAGVNDKITFYFFFDTYWYADAENFADGS